MDHRGPAEGDARVLAVLRWFEVSRRDLPWRADDRTPWGVLVSEVMLQQTPVARVLPAWQAWLARWPTPAALAAEPPGAAVRAWGRLGYPRRALRLHEAAGAIVDRHGGELPDDEAALLALPGVGRYTAAAVRAFAFQQRAVVLDTNVRRVLARAVGGAEHPPPTVTVAERRRAEVLLPGDDAAAARWSAAAMELGALVCTSARPGCQRCPLRESCAWLAAGSPDYDGPSRPVQGFAGTDRQARGRLLEVLRAADGPVAREPLERAWLVDPIQRERALDSLVADGLVELVGSDEFVLPGLGGASARPDRAAAGLSAAVGPP